MQYFTEVKWSCDDVLEMMHLYQTDHQNQFFCYALLQSSCSEVFLIIIPVRSIDNWETLCFNLPCRSISHLWSYPGLSMLHSTWCAIGLYLLCTSLLFFPLAFTQQEISNNGPAWLDCAIHALPLSMVCPWMLLGTWSRILEISNVERHSSAFWKSGRREHCRVHPCVRMWELSALYWEAKRKSKPDTYL